MKTPNFPVEAKYFLDNLPWANCGEQVDLPGVKGVPSGHVFTLKPAVAPLGAGGAFPATVVAMTVANIDTDGPGGSRMEDQYWQGQTSLRNSDGSSLNSHKFPGFVLPPEIHEKFGVRMGDFGLACWGGKLRPFQFYDGGPHNKFGEISIWLARQLGIVSPSVSDHHAATFGNDVADLCSIIFPGSGPGHAFDVRTIYESVSGLAHQLSTGLAGPYQSYV